ncbi:tRNA 2-thiouridine(34) synthase MnmA [Candidatus Portiera aleyrodidarum]|uniref:tRNA 2-thiouridine(34) synthase MnmA n=1 Tax=Candidatus Portiera aleyrodidarum TaxID=91844 RepID=UPI000C782A7B|nr:tRNA 2-thiouridine(34) synthase MnmA [Candidatus Portiera aleyrodidarum]AUI73208.1 tRNA 2-thiouridine(34) synthase MnmA [Candidatus Portiera aleyrodidarum]
MKKIIVCMSGGIDSSLCAFLLLQKGYKVEGLFMKNWELNSQCKLQNEVSDVKYICNRLKIVLHIVNFTSEYWSNVFKNFLQEFIYGKTPNPDSLCNKEIKFNLLTKYAFNVLNADYMSTGHYIRLTNKLFFKSLDLNKDQSYYLYNINKYYIHKLLFPIGFYNKFEIRKLAKFLFYKLNFKQESFGICFVGNHKFTSFLNKFFPFNFGNIVTKNNLIIGQHKGLFFYTNGQTNGFNITKTFNKTVWYVIKKKIHKNILSVAKTKNKILYTNSLIANNVIWLKNPFDKTINKITLYAKIRYRQIDQQCIVYNFINYIKVSFLYKQKGITEGQTIVLYHNNFCFGGAIIYSTYNRT